MPLSNGRGIFGAGPAISEYGLTPKPPSRSISLNAIGCKWERGCQPTSLGRHLPISVTNSSQPSKAGFTVANSHWPRSTTTSVAVTCSSRRLADSDPCRFKSCLSHFVFLTDFNGSQPVSFPCNPEGCVSCCDRQCERSESAVLFSIVLTRLP